MKRIRRIAADISGVGEKRIWLDPMHKGEIDKTMTREDVRGLVAKGHIKVLRVKGVPRTRGRIWEKRKRKGRGRGIGKRRGGAGARKDKKGAWMERIRAQRRLLKNLKESGRLKKGYRTLYLLAKGGTFKDKAHLLAYAEERGFLSK